MNSALRPFAVPHVLTDGKSIFTRNLLPGRRVYGETLVEHEGSEWRAWNPRRSKLAALLLKGCLTFPFEERSEVLYLGAATGTTSSHISDIAVKGTVYCVEISQWAMRRFIENCGDRKNMVPILADANKPERYASQVEEVDVLYQDIAQRDQVGIFLKNLRFLKKGGTGYLVIKARSVDVSAEPAVVHRRAMRTVEDHGLRALELIELQPFDRDHAVIIIGK